MIWQDIVISAANLVFTAALWPSIRERAGSGIPLTTSILTAGGLFTISVTSLTISLYLAALITLIEGVGWSWLAFQRKAVA